MSWHSAHANPEEAISDRCGAQFVNTPALQAGHCCVRELPERAGAVGRLHWLELLEAHEAGAALVKLFSRRWVSNYRQGCAGTVAISKNSAPAPGVSAANARVSGSRAVALGIGGNPIAKQAVAAGAFDQIALRRRASV
ncbi:MAG: hypothetical protein U0074_10815 [Kouleothrix sp.]